MKFFDSATFLLIFLSHEICPENIAVSVFWYSLYVSVKVTLTEGKCVICDWEERFKFKLNRPIASHIFTGSLVAII